MSKKVAVVYHSGYGHTAKVADAVVEGVKKGGVHVDQVRIDENGQLSDEAWGLLDAADAIIMGTPTYMGGPSWQFKRFADTSSMRWMKGMWRDKLAAGFTNSGSLSGDKLATLQGLNVLAMQHSMIWVSLGQGGPQPKGTDMPTISDINRIGSFTGLMTQSNNESAEIVPPQGDLETAKLFGERVATICKRFS
ncbi:MAG: flavodoxin family protein [Alphaproteobacteria bacterium]|nr:flavodoxin family protein [Alphaproteobacteria bacterium]